MRRVLVAAALLLAASFAAGCAAQEEKKAKDLVIELPGSAEEPEKKTMHRPAGEKRKAHGMRKKQRLRIRRGKREF